MNRGIDHLVLGVQDLDAARDAYARFGFTTTPRAVHPFGTGNSLVQLQGNFLELLTIVDERNFSAPEPNRFEFGRFNKEFLENGEGMSMLVFEGHDAAADCADFSANGLNTYEPFHFERKATLPDGEQVTVAFSLAFVTDPRMPDAAFFTCQQHAPEYFWKPDYQRHANGAIAVSEVVMVADDPAALADLFAGMQGSDAVSSEEGALSVATARGKVTVSTPHAFETRFGLAAPHRRGPHFAAFVIAVADLQKTEALLQDNGVPFSKSSTGLTVGPDDAFGCVIEFAATV